MKGRIQLGVWSVALAMPLAFAQPLAAQQPAGGARADRPAPAENPAFARHRSDWLRKHKDLPTAEQEKALRSEPHFQQLPPERQQKLVDRLHEFDHLPADQKDRLLNRMHAYESMTPEQQLQFQKLQQKVKGLPEDRRQSIHKALRILHAMSPAEQQKALESDQFKGRFSGEERDVLKQLMEIAPADPEPTDAIPPHSQ